MTRRLTKRRLKKKSKIVNIETTTLKNAWSFFLLKLKMKNKNFKIIFFLVGIKSKLKSK